MQLLADQVVQLLRKKQNGEENYNSHTTNSAFLLPPTSLQPESNAASNMKVNIIIQKKMQKNPPISGQRSQKKKRKTLKVQRKSWGQFMEVEEFNPFSLISQVTDSKISHSDSSSNNGYQQETTGAKILKEKKLFHLIKLRQQDSGSKAFYQFFPCLLSHQMVLDVEQLWKQVVSDQRSKKRNLKKPESSIQIVERENNSIKFYRISWAHFFHLNMYCSYPN